MVTAAHSDLSMGSWRSGSGALASSCVKNSCSNYPFCHKKDCPTIESHSKSRITLIRAVWLTWLTAPIASFEISRCVALLRTWLAMMVVISLGISCPLDFIGTRSVTPLLRLRSAAPGLWIRWRSHPQTRCGGALPLHSLLCAVEKCS